MHTTESAQPWVWRFAAPPGPDAPADAATADDVSIPHLKTADLASTDAAAVATVAADATSTADDRKLGVPPRERDARREIDRLRDEIEQLVKAEGDPRAVVDSALESVTRLQIVTANIDACGPPPAKFAGAALVALADSRLTGHADAIERGMEYTADNQLRLLNGEK